MSRRTGQPPRTAILYRTHFWSAELAAECQRLRGQLPANYDIFVIGYIAGAAMFSTGNTVACFCYTAADLQTLGYQQIPAQPARYQDLPPLRFFHDHPQYDYYWMIEYDVRFTGNWRRLFKKLSAPAADLLGTNIQTRAENPDWFHWPSLSTAAADPDSLRYVKVFTPLMRISNAAMMAIDAAYKMGWRGHYEALWATAIASANLAIADIGGHGSFTPPHRKGRYYTASPLDPYLAPGSFVFRPAIPTTKKLPRRPQLWHPVKPPALCEPAPAAPENHASKLLF